MALVLPHFELLDDDTLASVIAGLADGSIPLAKLAALTASRLVVTNGSGVLAAHSALTANRAVVSDANGLPTHATTTAAEIELVNGLAAALQTQLDIATSGVYGYTFSSSTTMADPGTGVFRLNNATFSSVTAIAISDTDWRGVDRDGQLDSTTGFYLEFIQTSNALVRALFKVSSPTDNGTWHQLTVVHIAGLNPPFSNGSTCTVRIRTEIQVAEMIALTASRVAVLNSSGYLAAATLTSANLETAACTKSDTARIALTLSANNLSADLVPDSVTSTYLAAQAGAQARIGSVGALATAIASTSYANAASCDADLIASSRVLVMAAAYHDHVSGTTTYALRRGTTVISDEPAYIFDNTVVLFAAEDSPGAGTSTYHLSVKNTTPAGTHSYARICYVEVR